MYVSFDQAFTRICWTINRYFVITTAGIKFSFAVVQIPPASSECCYISSGPSWSKITEYRLSRCCGCSLYYLSLMNSIKPSLHFFTFKRLVWLLSMDQLLPEYLYCSLLKFKFLIWPNRFLPWPSYAYCN